LLLPFKISELNKDIKAGKDKNQIEKKLKSITKKVSEKLSDAHNREVISDNDYYILMNAINFTFTLLFNKIHNYKNYKKEVIEMVKTLTLEEKRQIREEGIEKGREEGIEKGREEGIEKGILILKKLYEKGRITKEEYLEEVEKLKN